VIGTFQLTGLHCKEIGIYIFPKKELRGLCTNFHIHVSVSDLYIPTFGPPNIFLQQKRQTDQRNIQIANRNMNAVIGTVATQFLPGNICFEVLVLCLCRVGKAVQAEGFTCVNLIVW
jgi:hypothetical protein